MAETARWRPRVENGCLFIDDTEHGGVMLQHHAQPGTGSYIHPLRIAPGHLCLTEDSPWHHPHQHGIQTRFVGINGSDFWHFPGQRPGQTLGRINPALPRVTATEPPRWTIEALWQHADGRHVLADRQEWSLDSADGVLTLDLDWTLRAIPDVRIEPYDYGGLYVRIPYRSHLGAQVINSAGLRDGAAEQQPAAWVDVHMPIDQGRHGDSVTRQTMIIDGQASSVGRHSGGTRRADAPPASAGIAVFDHPANPGHPAHWRVDRQCGINPAPSIAGAIELAAGSALRLRYRLLAHRGPLAAQRIAAAWSAYAAA